MASLAAAAAQFKSRLTHSCSALNDIIDEAVIHRLAAEVAHARRDCFWRPAVVILTFLRRAPPPDCSCRRAVVLSVRVVRTMTTDRRGFRRRPLERVTTLVEPAACPAAALAKPYRDRWLAEVSLRSLKITQGMDTPRCKSVAMVEKELVMRQIACNAVRLLMREAAVQHGVDLHRLSFAGTQQRPAGTLTAVAASLVEPLETLWESLLERIALDRIPCRPTSPLGRARTRPHADYREHAPAAHEAASPSSRSVISPHSGHCCDDAEFAG